MQLDHAACALFRRINNTRIKRARINVQTHRTLSKMFWIHHSVHWVCGIDSARVGWVHFHRVRRRELRASFLNILGDEVKIFDKQAANGD